MGRVVFTHPALPAIRPVNHLVDRGRVIIRRHTGAAILSAAQQAVVVADLVTGFRLTPAPVLDPLPPAVR